MDFFSSRPIDGVVYTDSASFVERAKYRSSSVHRKVGHTNRPVPSNVRASF
jgi:hypothetical protein